MAHVLVLGGYGFIGDAICRKLIARGHRVTGLGRNPEKARRRLPQACWLSADLKHMDKASGWASILSGVDVVVNAAGTLQDSARDNVTAVQRDAALALIDAALSLPTSPLLIQISAETGAAGSDTTFMTTKREADEALKASGLPCVIMRPGLVIGRNAYGGTALIRALAAFPGVTPLVFGDMQVETVALDDVTTLVTKAVEGELPPGSDLKLVCDEVRSLKTCVSEHRAWLGLEPVKVIELPKWLGTCVSWLADAAGRLGWRSPLRSTALSVMEGGVRSKQGDRPTIPLRTLRQTLQGFGAGVQDVWFARLYLIKPVLFAGLSIFWIASGIIALVGFQSSSAYLEAAGLSYRPAALITLLTSLADILLGGMVLFRRWASSALIGMLLVSLSYLLAATFLMPVLWLDPLGPLVKVIPACLLTLAALCILEER